MFLSNSISIFLNSYGFFLGAPWAPSEGFLGAQRVEEGAPDSPGTGFGALVTHLSRVPKAQRTWHTAGCELFAVGCEI